MQIHIIAVGKIKEEYLREGVAEYEKRLRPYLNLMIVELTEEKRSASASQSAEKTAIVKEGERILAVIPSGSYIVALDIGGTSWSSPELAGFLRQRELAGKNQITFIIGGDLGLSPKVLSESDMQLSLSKMTLTHQMIRLLLMEQIYRACRINSGEPYHK
ncbi:MAG TPA: 23S rRNA (pseudouridine(1915)-N(3))-methyltransferase RlmH [Methanoregula sp.]|nr:23S rRNA (pseudouridine(1915)-N(3))-methyltransferase RlmH [Methanoregula sp.]